jgi:DNA-directed RNA polymerase subunit M/transcription elongation factor TFIIS
MLNLDELTEKYLQEFIRFNDITDISDSQRKLILDLRKRDLLRSDVSEEEITTNPYLTPRQLVKNRFAYVSEVLYESDLKRKNISYTKAYTCSKCKKSQCTVKYMQTRSADESMTGFITCNYCNNKWKT